MKHSVQVVCTEWSLAIIELGRYMSIHISHMLLKLTVIQWFLSWGNFFLKQLLLFPYNELLLLLLMYFGVSYKTEEPDFAAVKCCELESKIFLVLENHIHVWTDFIDRSGRTTFTRAIVNIIIVSWWTNSMEN